MTYLDEEGILASNLETFATLVRKSTRPGWPRLVRTIASRTKCNTPSRLVLSLHKTSSAARSSFASLSTRKRHCSSLRGGCEHQHG